MAFFLIIFGLMMVVAAVKGTEKEFLGVVLDMAIQPQFLQWGLVILLAGVAGYMKEFRSFSVTLMTLILIAMVLSNKSVVTEFFKQVETVTPPKNPLAVAQ